MGIEELPTRASRKAYNLLKRMMWACVSCVAVALMSWAGFIAVVYNIDCASGDASSVFEIPSKFSVELYCPIVTEADNI